MRPFFSGLHLYSLFSSHIPLLRGVVERYGYYQGGFERGGVAVECYLPLPQEDCGDGTTVGPRFHRPPLRPGRQDHQHRPHGPVAPTIHARGCNPMPEHPAPSWHRRPA